MVDGQGTEPAMTENERLETIAKLVKRSPDRDLSKLLAGHLAGPADPDRPPVPIWDFAEYAASAGVEMETLLEWRYPLEFFRGGSTVVSVAEELRDDLPGITPLVASDVIRRYRLLADAGALAWNADCKSMVAMSPHDEWSPIYRVWSDEMKSRSL